MIWRATASTERIFWRSLAKFGSCANKPQNNQPTGGSSVELGFEPGTLRLKRRDLTTRPPRPSLHLKFRPKQVWSAHRIAKRQLSDIPHTKKN
ncbi:hypothetical protein AVEN_270596-1 [Araneus ventricosus]|uniref:Uncharacterized protein n=1 Tax=Araneus ventricosus TaxID=182803 RepID=A0A4Y2DIR9_ARAVE|nr:hypothetical protein AVEN_270596-1 [Araneus ventricosus]